MIQIFKITLGLSLLILTSCSGEHHQVVVVKDCSGTYLKYNHKDYKVINESKLIGFNNGDIINAQFHEEWVECPTSGTMCLMPHDFEYYIEINKIY